MSFLRRQESPMQKYYFVYIISNKLHTVLYIGVTSNLPKRVWEHKKKLVEGFTSKYNVSKLVYYEMFQEVEKAIEREKRLKTWKREWKERIINEMNPDWKDLYQSLL